MYTFLKSLILFTLFNKTDTHELHPVGSQVDEHDCVLDGGYEWCESAQECQRPWEYPCISIDTQFCEASNVQLCHVGCPNPVCREGECAMRHGSCCDYTCEDTRSPLTQCPEECPPEIPCPLPPQTHELNCHFSVPVPNNCGCNSGCGTIDCSTHYQIPEGYTCGGLVYDEGSCEGGLECVQTMGPYVADAPGTCQPICNTVRDNWGNCVTEGCKTWFDSCNTCIVNEDYELICTEEICYHGISSAICIDGEGTITPDPIIPKNCVTWYDGCNTCSVSNGILQGCTLMMCITQTEPYCQVFTSGELEEGELCYRFCEDNSQNFINRKKDCPSGTVCSLLPGLGNTFDNCGEMSHTCNRITGH